MSLSRRRFALGYAFMAATAGLPRFGRAASAPLLVMAAAGYRRPVDALCAAFTSVSAAPVERSYGNLEQLFAQIRASSRVDVLIGDGQFVDQAKGIDLPQRVPLGQGIMVLAWRKKALGHSGLQSITDPVRDLAAAHSIALTNPQGSIYGKGAKEWLMAKGLWGPLQDNLKMVQTIPQISAYLTSGQVDVGFINLTEALGIKAQLGGYLQLQPGPGSYSPIDIVAAMPAAGAGDSATGSARAEFARFLQTAQARDILRENGL